MKRTTTYNTARLFVACLSLLMATACSNIDEDERFIYVEPAEVQRAVLIEDFTGQNCLNCPRAHETIAKLQEQYGKDQVVAVSIHGGNMAVWTNSRMLGLRNDLGDEYNNFWGCTSWPTGMVNRKGGLSTDEQWATAVYNEIQKAPPVRISVWTIQQTGERRYSVTVNLLATEDYSGKLQLWITENGIVAPQRMPDGSVNATYTHNNVLRAAANGTWGTELRLARGEHHTDVFNFETDAEWKTENLNLVVFAYNGEGVQQALCQQLAPSPTESE